MLCYCGDVENGEGKSSVPKNTYLLIYLLIVFLIVGNVIIATVLWVGSERTGMVITALKHRDFGAAGTLLKTSKQEPRALQTASDNAPPFPVGSDITVFPLDTKYEKGGLVPQYPASIAVSAPQRFAGQLGAYGVSELVLVGPEGWTGNGYIGADGKGVASLYPVGGSADAGARVVVLTPPSCVSCIYHLAAPYFLPARQWVEENEKVPVSEKEGVVGDVVTPRLLRYSLPNTPDGMEVNGAAYFNENISGQTPAQPYFISMEVTLPSSQHDLAIFLLDLFVQRRKLE